MNNTRLKELLDKYLQGTATDIEISEVDIGTGLSKMIPHLPHYSVRSKRTALEQLLFLRISRQVEAAETPLRISHRRIRWVAAASLALPSCGW